VAFGGATVPPEDGFSSWARARAADPPESNPHLSRARSPVSSV